MYRIEFDDIIYALQNFGGASVYWRNVTSLVDQDPRFHTRHLKSGKLLRGIPAISNAELFHSSHFRHCISRGTKVISTVHDLTYEMGDAGVGLGAKLNISERKLSFFLADALICISESTKSDLLQIYPQLKNRTPIHVIHHGYTQGTAEPKTTFDPIKLYGPYILYVGARRGYKNFFGALRGFYESLLWKDGVKLLCTGASFDESEISEISSLHLTGHVQALGKVDEPRLLALYESAYCLLYTSKREGFGLPLLEAMSKGCPVIACNTSCIPEICGESALLVSPDSIEEIASALKKLQDSALRSQLIRSSSERVKKFSWKKSAEEHMEAYIKTIKS